MLVDPPEQEQVVLAAPARVPFAAPRLERQRPQPLLAERLHERVELPHTDHLLREVRRVELDAVVDDQTLVLAVRRLGVLAAVTTLIAAASRLCAVGLASATVC